jgi:hypothetical protein
MTKAMVVAALGMAFVVGCDSMKKKDDDMSSSPKKMSVQAKDGKSCDKCTAKP